jgi:hypothetical protein
MIKFFTYLLCFLCIATSAIAADLHIGASATGDESGSDGSNLCTLAYANTNLSAGETGYLYDTQGDYSTAIAPSNSGSSDNKITYIAQSGDSPKITNTSNGFIALNLDGNDYIVVDGIELVSNADNGHIVDFRNGARYNEVKNCKIHGNLTASANGGIVIRTLNATSETANTHNWFHDNEIYESGLVDPSNCEDTSNTAKIGLSSDYLSGYNTFEDNEWYGGGHHLLEIYTRNNVIRNNYFHNEPWIAPNGSNCTECTALDSSAPIESGLYGNRCVILEGDGSTDTPSYNLFEGNRLGYSGPPSDGNGATGLAIISRRNIIRYNDFFDHDEIGIFLRDGDDSNDNRIYNNSVYGTGQTAPACRGWTGNGLEVHGSSTGSYVYNNIFYLNEMDIQCNDSHQCNGITASSNLVTSNELSDASGQDTGDPSFTDMSISDPTSQVLPNFVLQLDSPAIDAGTYLTQANGDAAGGSSDTLIVDDAKWFQDGSWGSGLATLDADYIIISSSAIDASSGTEVEISSIDYDTNTITLSSEQNWSDGDYIFLGKDSNGTDVLIGDMPDQGAHEWQATGGLRGVTCNGCTM